MAAGGATTWRQEVPSELLVPVDEDDLFELLGAFLENAAEWARSDVLVAAWAEDASVVLLIQDDGSGISFQHRRTALTRSARLTQG